MVFHVYNRGNRKARLFFTPADYDAFLRVVVEASSRVNMRILAIELMPNHWHLVLWPRADGDLSKFVGWISLTHACRWQRVHETRGTGPVYQGRFKALPVQSDDSLINVLRYVEQNAPRAGLVKRAEDWPWSSACIDPHPDFPAIAKWPIPRPPNWLGILNSPENPNDLITLRRCVVNSTPYGSEEWRKETVARLGWTRGLRPVGRPRRSDMRTDGQS